MSLLRDFAYLIFSSNVVCMMQSDAYIGERYSVNVLVDNCIRLYLYYHQSKISFDIRQCILNGLGVTSNRDT